MNTDNKAVARWDIDCMRAQMDSFDDGDYVLFTDHERVVGELQAARNHDFKLFALADENIASLRAALAASRAEVEGLRGFASEYVSAYTSGYDGDDYLMNRANSLLGRGCNERQG